MSQWIPITIQILAWGLLLIAAFHDLKRFILPDYLVFPSLVLALVSMLIAGFEWQFFLLALIPAALLLFLGIAFQDALKREALGMGDVKLSLALGLLCGFPLGMLGLFVASVTAILTRLILIRAKKKDWNDPVPFGFYLVLASGLVVLV